MMFGRRKVEIDQFKRRYFQFPLGIRWCSDTQGWLEQWQRNGWTFNSLWELDGVRTTGDAIIIADGEMAFNSLWELDGVRTGCGHHYVPDCPTLSIPCGNLMVFGLFEP